MRLPVPTNRLVALTLLGALLTAVVAVGLTAPSLFPGTDPADAGQPAQGQLSADAPTPNASFSPAVQTADAQREHEDLEEREDEEHEDEEDEDDREPEEYGD